VGGHQEQAADALSRPRRADVKGRWRDRWGGDDLHTWDLVSAQTGFYMTNGQRADPAETPMRQSVRELGAPGTPAR
jgi:hypothetical protein